MISFDQLVEVIDEQVENKDDYDGSVNYDL